MTSQKNSHPQNWKYSSPEEEGFHKVISPENSDCQITSIFRLNLRAGARYALQRDDLELHGAVIDGEALVKHESGEMQLKPRDTFYLPGGDKLIIEAQKPLFMFIGGSLEEGKGRFFTRQYDLSLPEGAIHQVHGKPPYQRQVFLTVSPQDNASRLICGITEGEPGKWTSWPPHQHSKDLEEIYCYFNAPAPKFSLHIASRQAGTIEHVHPVSTGDCVIIPEGYHPTVGSPGTTSCYFWVMAAHKPESRRYDLAQTDPNYCE